MFVTLIITIDLEPWLLKCKWKHSAIMIPEMLITAKQVTSPEIK
jgi:hypothetical protein